MNNEYDNNPFFSEGDAYDEAGLYWFLRSGREDGVKIWTKGHIKELVNDFYVVNKHLKRFNFKQIVHAKWEHRDPSGKEECRCTHCGETVESPDGTHYCPNCGAAFSVCGKKTFRISDAYDYGTLSCWYQDSIDENEPPVWTDKHIEELMSNYYVVPRSAAPVDFMPVIKATMLAEDDGIFECTACHIRRTLPLTSHFCRNCGAEISGTL